MKVKIRNQIYDASTEPIIIYLSDEDKKNIADMCPDCNIFASWPDNYFLSKHMEERWFRQEVVDGFQSKAEG